MIYYVYNIKTGDSDFAGSYKECEEFISNQCKEDRYYLEIRGGN